MLVEIWLLKITQLRAYTEERAVEKAFTVLENAYNVVNSVFARNTGVKATSGEI